MIRLQLLNLDGETQVEEVLNAALQAAQSAKDNKETWECALMNDGVTVKAQKRDQRDPETMIIFSSYASGDAGGLSAKTCPLLANVQRTNLRNVINQVS